MALTKKQRAELKKEGLDAASMKKLEAILDADADDNNGSGGGKSSGKRVVVYEGDDAESFMKGLFGSKDEGDDEDEDEDEDDEDEAEPDDKPKGRTRWFG